MSSGKWQWNMDQAGINAYFLNMMHDHANNDIPWYTMLCHLAECMVD